MNQSRNRDVGLAGHPTQFAAHTLSEAALPSFEFKQVMNWIEDDGEVFEINHGDAEGEYVIIGRNGVVPFTSPIGGTTTKLQIDGNAAWAADVNGDRGRGLEALRQCDRDQLVNSYLEAALKTSIDGTTGEEFDGEFTIYDIDPDSMDQVTDDLDEFLKTNGGLVRRMLDEDRYTTYEQIGHDFWLTRNGHGAGFWDRGLGKLGDDLTDAAKAFREIDPFSINGKVYVA